MSDPFALDDPPPAPSAVTAPARAHVVPLRRSQDGFDAELLGRVSGNRMVKVRRGDTIFAVDVFRLHAVDKTPGQPRRRLSNAEINALPWQGAGPDPLTHHEPPKPWRRRG
jgi:hypothetical protein